ncbi:hypothetical protein CK203_090449 [Vitis vinifera]|uniref:Uncharacterized protein n=1 Tax=Vitis vinifera TaxID=29760 RepID=A0A438BVQ5_VITVI|nr:hypothetical protein CK203_090449 [Vitis vinifera]
MEEEISLNYICYPTAKAFWDNIIQMHSDLGNESQIYELQLKLGDICHDDCNYFKKMEEGSRIFKFLVGLNVEFDEIWGRIIGWQPLPSIAAASHNLIISVVRMTNQEFGVIIVINHTTRETCWKLHGRPVDWKLVEWKTNKQGNSNHFPAKAHAA